MSSYMYCDNCDTGLDKPTPREVIEDHWECGLCDHVQDIMDDDKRDALLNMLDRIEALERETPSPGCPLPGDRGVERD